LCFFERLVADHVDAGFEECGGYRRMEMIRRDDGHHLDAIRPRGFGARHLAVVGIRARRVQADRRAGTL
jgi:hypothetical protein